MGAAAVIVPLLVVEYSLSAPGAVLGAVSGTSRGYCVKGRQSAEKEGMQIHGGAERLAYWKQYSVVPRFVTMTMNEVKIRIYLSHIRVSSHMLEISGT